MPNQPENLAPEQALERLRAGNQRFISGETRRVQSGWRPGLEVGQRPFAVVLGCSDSRSPAELVFDQGLGELFVVRIAGNVVAPSGIGSVEFAAEQFGTRLVVVMGHSHCGAVTAALDELAQGASASRNVRAITDRIRPHVAELYFSEPRPEPEELLRRSVRANVRVSCDQLRHGSSLLEQMISSGWMRVVGAYYDLVSGEVQLLD
jgi:carbonic anhydrase